MSDETFVILGAGLAGAKAAIELRERGFAGRVLLIGTESELPYERPPLSKDYLRGDSERDDLYVESETFYQEKEIELLLGHAVTEIDPGARSVQLERHGADITYDALLIATGSRPRRLQLPGAELQGIHYLRTIADSDAIGERLEQGGHVAVVGGGWIGCEIAASARQKGLDVTLISDQPLPLESLGRQVGEFYRNVHASQGVALVLDDGLAAFEGTADTVQRVRTESGRVVECDFVVVGAGAMPNVELGQRAGLDTDNGILVDPRLQTSVPGVFAAGDVANQLHPFYERRVRVEHWANAQSQGTHAAHSMRGSERGYKELPYFFSDQYDVGMEYSGLPEQSDRVVLRGDYDGGEFVAFWLRDGVVTAGMNVNVWDVNEHVQELIRSRRRVDEAKLTDPDTSLESLTG
ncbi:MAG TPA: FAD-dependent oxidoreductase [Solirubrobacteraceae bacterium]|nr:FAD-dependent oxidoreductase [Solirubrobacteraceae bacterium]